MNKTRKHLRETLENLLQTAQFDSLIETCKAALLDARNRKDKETEALALIGLAQGHKFSGKFKDALLLTDGAITIAQAIANQELLVQATLSRASVHLIGTYQTYEAEQDYRDALGRAYDQDDQAAVSEALAGIAAVLNHRGDVSHAEGFAVEAFRLAREIKQAYWMSNALSVLGSIFGSSRQAEKGLKAFQDAIDIAQRENYRILEVGLMANIGQLLIEQGRYAQEGQQMLEKALHMAQEISSVPDQFMILFRLGRAAEMQAIIEQAAEHYNVMLVRSQEWQTRAYEGLAFFNLGVLAYNRKHFDDALANLEQSLLIARETKNPYQEAQIEQVLAVTYSSLHHWEQALDHYMAARSLYDALDNRQMAGQMMQAILMTYLRRFFDTILKWLGLGQKDDTTPPEM